MKVKKRLDALLTEQGYAENRTKAQAIIMSGIVYVDGEALDESYTFEPTYRSYLEIGEGLDYPVTVPEGSVFVLGDNRNHSADSRYAPLGCVDESRILGRVLLRILPGRQTNEEGDVVGGRDFRRIGAVS